MKLTWWWTVINIDETFTIMILLLWIEMILQCCDFTIFTGWIDMKNKNTCKKKLFHNNGWVTDWKITTYSLMDKVEDELSPIFIIMF
jgi:hypothetical protein